MYKRQVYFGLLLILTQVGVAESEKRVAAIFLLPVWPLEPPGGSFLPYSGLYCRRIAHRRSEMLSIRKPGAPNLNLWPGSTIQKPEVLTKVPEIARNVVKLTVIRKTRVKSRHGQTWSGLAKPEVVVYFGLLLILTQVGVAQSEKRVAAIFLLPVWAVEPPKRRCSRRRAGLRVNNQSSHPVRDPGLLWEHWTHWRRQGGPGGPAPQLPFRKEFFFVKIEGQLETVVLNLSFRVRSNAMFTSERRY